MYASTSGSLFELFPFQKAGFKRSKNTGPV
jgi:hypothetical protein